VQICILMHSISISLSLTHTHTHTHTHTFPPSHLTKWFGIGVDNWEKPILVMNDHFATHRCAVTSQNWVNVVVVVVKVKFFLYLLHDLIKMDFLLTNTRLVYQSFETSRRLTKPHSNQSPGMALTPLTSSIGRGLNPRLSDCELSTLPLDHFCN